MAARDFPRVFPGDGSTTDGSEFQYFGSDVWIPGLDLVQQRVDFAEALGLQNIIIWELGQDLDPRNALSMLRSAFQTDGDFNADGLWDCTDIDALTTAIASMGTDLALDMNGDGAISLADITNADVGWLAVGGANNPSATGGGTFLAADANLDGVVDGQDFIRWNNHKFTDSARWCAGDFNADSVVDGQDFIVWNDNKFASSSDELRIVPEPAIRLLWLLILFVTWPRQVPER